jgi:hypothetical protein
MLGIYKVFRGSCTTIKCPSETATTTCTPTRLIAIDPCRFLAYVPTCCIWTINRSPHMPGCTEVNLHFHIFFKLADSVLPDPDMLSSQFLDLCYISVLFCHVFHDFQPMVSSDFVRDSSSSKMRDYGSVSPSDFKRFKDCKKSTWGFRHGVFILSATARLYHSRLGGEFF